jgi:hypothetical protein
MPHPVRAPKLFLDRARLSVGYSVGEREFSTGVSRALLSDTAKTRSTDARAPRPAAKAQQAEPQFTAFESGTVLEIPMGKWTAAQATAAEGAGTSGHEYFQPLQVLRDETSALGAPNVHEPAQTGLKIICAALRDSINSPKPRRPSCAPPTRGSR